MLDAWERKMRHNTNGRAQVFAPIACTPDESNPIAARDFICASCPPWIRHFENIRRCQ
jgi:hypothetical protein